MFYLALFLSITLNAASLVLLKAYAIRPIRTNSGAKALFTGRFSRLLDWRLVVSVALYGFAAVAWLFALAGVDLMIAYPSLSVTYVAIALVSPRLFSERIEKNQWAGMVLIVAGVIVMHVL